MFQINAFAKRAGPPLVLIMMSIAMVSCKTATVSSSSPSPQSTEQTAAKSGITGQTQVMDLAPLGVGDTLFYREAGMSDGTNRSSVTIATVGASGFTDTNGNSRDAFGNFVRVENGDDYFTPSHTLMPPSVELVDGMTWGGKSISEGGDFTKFDAERNRVWKFSSPCMLAKEQVAVPAGTFDTWKATCTRYGERGRTWNITTWFDGDTRIMVKQTQQRPGRSAATIELAEIKRAKPVPVAMK